MLMVNIGKVSVRMLDWQMPVSMAMWNARFHRIFVRMLVMSVMLVLMIMLVLYMLMQVIMILGEM